MSTAETLYYRCIPEFVTLDPDLHPFSSHLFTCIAHKAYLNNGRVQMTIEYLAAISRLSVKSVLRYLLPLEEKGYIRVTREPRGSKIPNTYEIIGTAAEVVVRNGKPEARSAPAGASTGSGQGTGSPSTGKRVSVGQSSSLNDQGSGVQSLGVKRPPAAPDGVSGLPSMAPQTPDQVPDRPLTNEQEKQENHEVLNVVDSENTCPIYALKGVHPTVMQGWIEQYGINRVQDVIQGLGRQKYVANKGGWMRAALEGGWRVKGSTSVEYVNDAQRYITGEYAAYIDH